VQLIDPVFVYPNSRQSGAGEITGVAVVGGYVYRGGSIPGLDGRYLFGDFSAPQGGLLLVATTARPAGRSKRSSFRTGSVAGSAICSKVSVRIETERSTC
jgi:hypothetical protein